MRSRNMTKASLLSLVVVGAAGLVESWGQGRAMAGLVDYDQVFLRGGQNLYGSGSDSGFDKKYKLAEKSWDNYDLPASQSSALLVDNSLVTGYVSGRVFPGSARVDLNVAATAGKADIAINRNLQFTFPDRVASGAGIGIGTSSFIKGGPGEGSSFAVQGPEASAKLSASLNAKVTMGAGYDILDPTGITNYLGLNPYHLDGTSGAIPTGSAFSSAYFHREDKTLFSTWAVPQGQTAPAPAEKEYTLATVSTGGQGVDLLDNSFGGMRIEAPKGLSKTQTFFQSAGTIKVEAESSNSIVSGKVSIPRALGLIPGLQPLLALKGSASLFGADAGTSNDASGNVVKLVGPNLDGTTGPGNLSIDYTFFDALLTAGVSAKLVATFTPSALNVKVLGPGGTQEGVMGNGFTFTAPENNSEQDILVGFSAETWMDGVMTIDVRLVPEAGLSVELLKGKATLFGYSLPEVGPLYSDAASTPLPEFSLYSNSFTVTGFNKSSAGWQVAVAGIPEPSALTMLSLAVPVMMRRARR